MKKIIAIAVVVFATGCPSEEEIQEEWDLWVEENNACTTVDDCALIGPGCPLGCATAVTKGREEAAREKAADLIRRYERGANTCQYACMPTEPACVEQRCVVEVQY